jgi:protein SCO1
MRLSPLHRPTRRLRRTLPVLLAASAALLLAACGGGAPGAPPASQGLVLNRPTPQNLGLVNQQDKPVSLADLRGKDVVMAPFLTLCQDECPLVLSAFIGLKRDVDAAGLGKKVVFLEVTVDPGRDNPFRLAAYQKEFGADWDLWTGTAAQIAAFWKPFGVSYQIVPEEQPPINDWLTGKPLTYDVDHTDGYMLLNTNGRERFVDASAPNLGGHLSAKLTKLLNAGGVKELHNPTGQEWTIDDALSAISWLVGTTINPVS